jgi:hypothetical protein
MTRDRFDQGWTELKNEGKRKQRTDDKEPSLIHDFLLLFQPQQVIQTKFNSNQIK